MTEYERDELLRKCQLDRLLQQRKESEPKPGDQHSSVAMGDESNNEQAMAVAAEDGPNAGQSELLEPVTASAQEAPTKAPRHSFMTMRPVAA